MFTASPNSLLLGMAGIELYCQTVGLGGSGFNLYTPGSACGTFFYGLSGESYEVGSGGVTTFYPMTLGQGGAIWNELVVQIAAPSTTTTTTAYTATITGWLTPDAAHFSNTYLLIILPLAGMVFGLMPFMMFQRNEEIGDKAIYPSLFGLFAGSLFADLTTTTNSVLQVPFAIILTVGLLLFLWWWGS